MTNTLFTNANVILDGLAEQQGSFNVLVKGSTIHSVSSSPIDHDDATVIDVAGRAHGLVSYGSSGIVDRDGTVLQTARQFETGLVVAEIETNPMALA